MKKNVKGFTLIELMIVVAIIAIIAAIAIPSLLRSRIAANETSAVGTLRSLVSVEATWRQTDCDRNATSDYWTADVSAMYRVLRVGQAAGGTKIMAIDVGIAASDGNKYGGNAFTAGVLNPVSNVTAADVDALAQNASKSGYFCEAIVTTVDPAVVYAQDPDGDTVSTTNSSLFGFMAYPDVYDSTGVNVFIISEAGTCYSQDFGGTGNVSATMPAGWAVTPAGFAGGTVPAWPNANPASAGWRLVQ